MNGEFQTLKYCCIVRMIVLSLEIYNLIDRLRDVVSHFQCNICND